MKNHYFKLIFLAMFCCLSSMVFAGNVTTLTELQNALITANSAGGAQSIAVTASIAVNTDLSLVYTGGVSTDTLTINIATTGGVLTVSSGTLTIGNRVKIIETIANGITVSTGGSVVVNSGCRITNSSNPTIYASGGNLTITGGSISTISTGNPTNLKITNGSIVRISGGLIQNTSSSTSPNIITIDNTIGIGGKLYITGGTIQTSSSGGTAIYLNSTGAQLWISGSPVIYGKTYGISAIAGSRISLATTTATITGVTIGIKTAAGTVINNYSKSTAISPSVASGTYSSSQSVNLLGGTDLITQYTGAVNDTYLNIINGVTAGGTTVSASLLYTTNGSDPITSPISSTYSSAISIPVSTTLKVAPYILPSSTTVGVVSTFTYYIAPVFTTNYPVFDTQTTSGFNANVNINEPGKVYYVVLPSGATAPSPAQVKAGKDGAGITISSSNLKGTITCSAASTVYTSSITGLTAGTTYDVYFVAEDLAGMALQSSVTQLSPSTVAASSVADPVSVSSAVISQSQIDISFVRNANSNNVLIVWNTTNSFGTPTDGTAYSVGNTLPGAGGTILYNGGTSPFSHKSLTPGTKYYYKVWSVDGSSLYSPGMPTSNTTFAAEPITQASSITFSAITVAGMTVSWTNGDGANRLVLVKAGSAVDSNPVDGTGYTSNINFGTIGTQIGTGNYVVYNSTGSSVSITGLTGGTVYNVAVYEYNGTTGTYNYLTSTLATASQSSMMTAPSVPSVLTFSAVTSSSFKASFTAPGIAPTGYLVLRKTNAAVTGTPVPGITYTVGQSNIGSGTTPLNDVVYVGTNAWTGYDQTGLADNSYYSYAIYSYNGSGVTTNYSTALGGSQITSVISAPISNVATNVSSTGFTSNWSSVSGSIGYSLEINTSPNFPFSENFQRCLLGTPSVSDATDISASINTYTQTSGWSAQYTFQAGGTIRLGYSGGGSTSYLITPQTDLSSNSGNATITFDCSHYSTDVIAGFRVYHAADGVTFVPISGTDTITPSTMTTKSYVITGGTANSKIKIYNPYAGKRILIDNIKIYQVSNITGYDNLSVSGTSQDVTGLTPGINYFYRVRAVGANGSSPNSGIVSETVLDQSITFSSLNPATYGGAPFIVSATGGASLNPVTFTSSDPSVVTCTGTNGTTVTILKAGSCSIYANQNGIINCYNPSPQISQTLTVNPKYLTVTSAAATSKVYDGNNSAVITGTLTGKVGSDAVTLNGTGTFADVNVANDISITSTSTLGGAKAGNYLLTQPTGLTANITPVPLTITGLTGVSKVYDGTNAATFTGTPVYAGLVNSETFTVSGTGVATFADATVANAKTISLSGYTVPTANYSLTFPSLTANIYPTTSTWSGTGNWTTGGANWTYLPLNATDVTVASGELVIDQTSTVNSITVNPGAKLTLTNGKIINTGTITLQSDPTGTATYVDNGTSNIATANVQQFLNGATGTSTRGWWYVASPVSNATSTVFNIGATNNLWYYNEASDPNPTYSKITANDVPLITGTGYVANLGGDDATYTFTGNLNTGNINIVPTRTGTTAEKRGFNLIGNPYPSYLDWNAVTKTNVRNTIWYRTFTSGKTMQFDTFDGSHGTSNGVNGAVTQFIPPMQAFWVKVNADGDVASLALNNTMRSHKDVSNNLLRAKSDINPQVLRLKVSDGTNGDEALLVTNPDAVNSYDSYDSPKMTNSNVAIPEIYTLAGGEELVINNLNTISNNDQIPLGFRTGTSNNFSIQATEVANFDTDTRIILRDNLLNYEQDITDGTAYNFTSDVTTTDTRFNVIFKSGSTVTGINNHNSDNNFISVGKNINGQIIVNCLNGMVGHSTVSIFNSIGQKLESIRLASTVTELKNSYPSGVYMVSVESNGKINTQKVVIN